MTDIDFLILFSHFFLLTLFTTLYAYPYVEAQINTNGHEDDSDNGRGDGDTLEQKRQKSLPIVVSGYGNSASNRSDNLAGTIQIPYSGLITQGLTPTLAERLGLDTTTRGDLITDVLPGSPAERLGMQRLNLTKSKSPEEIIESRGDIILTADGSTSFTIDYRSIEEYIIDKKRVGENITLSLLRDSGVDEITMPLASKPIFQWYENTEQGVTIKYPSDWEAVEEDYLSEGFIIQFYSAEKTPSYPIMPAVNVTVFKFPSNYDETSSLDGISGIDFDTFRILDINTTRLGDLPAYRSIYYVYSQADNAFKVLSVFAEHGTDLYGLTFNVAPARYDDYVSTISEMINSFQLI